MGQNCSQDGTHDEGPVKDRRRSNKYNGKPTEEKSGAEVRVRSFEVDPRSPGAEGAGASTEWVANTAGEDGCAGLAYRCFPSPLLVPREALAQRFREYAGSRFGGQDNAFLGVASTASISGGKGAHGLICVGEGRDIHFLNYETGHIMGRWAGAHAKDINRVTNPSSPDGDMFFTASRDCTVKGWRAGEASSSTQFEGHSLNVTAVDPHPAGGRLATGSRDNSVRLWDIECGECVASQDVKLNIVHFVKWIPSLNTIAQGGEDLTVRLWDTRSERDSLNLVNTLANFDYHPICGDLVTEAEGGSENTLFTGHNGFNGAGSMITEWDLRQGSQVRHFRGHTLTIRGVRKLRNGPCAGCLISIGDDDTLRLWPSGPRHEGDLGDSVKPIATVSIPEGRPTAIDEAPDGKLMISLRSGAVIVMTAPATDRDGPVVERYRYVGTPFLE